MFKKINEIQRNGFKIVKKETLKEISKRFTMNMERMGKADDFWEKKMLNCSRVEEGGLKKEKSLKKYGRKKLYRVRQKYMKQIHYSIKPNRNAKQQAHVEP